ncbi:hypothetical protein AKJ09_02985 [Labilithrix luteola]|uniref:Lipoprotein n=1 Tax=Labilithrix luteola TaxID=1391654 RepID=A0A0K1PSI2_9BACT|nr:hypothetical protein [Labilithrix luteola]AKU96321.1 hypothetical protein AKJ09_02985 [Labilithrix luteola]
MKPSSPFVLATLAALAVLAALASLAALGCSGGETVTGTGRQSDGGRLNEPGRTADEPTGTTTPDPKSTDDASADTETPQPLRIENLNVIRTGANYEVTFVIKNDTAVDVNRVQSMTLSFDDMTASFTPNCQGALLAYGHSTTSIITWNLTYEPAYRAPVLGDGCGHRMSSDETSAPPWAGKLTVELHGLYEDGKAFAIKANAAP